MILSSRYTAYRIYTEQIISVTIQVFCHRDTEAQRSSIKLLLKFY